MLKLKTILALTVLFSILILTSCQNEPNPIESPEDESALFKLEIPAEATLTSATLYIFLTAQNDQPVTVHRITSDWQETAVTWNSFGGSYAAAEPNTFVASLPQEFKAVDITNLVAGWLDESYPNYGLLLDQGVNAYPFSEYFNKETYPDRAAYLEICYTLNGMSICDTTRAVADTYIWDAEPSTNFNDQVRVRAGRFDGSTSFEKQILIKFDLEQTGGGEECTRPAFYWGRHTQFGPGSRDANWDLILPNGENSEFFLSGKSYYQVLKTNPWYNAYYFLARQYIAAKLNVLSGAPIPAEIQDIFDNATVLFNTYTPAQVGSWGFWHPIRRDFRSKAFELAKYNWGLIGPGRCGCGN